MRKIYAILLFAILPLSSYAQSDTEMIRAIYDETLSNSLVYEDLRYLTKKIGHRLAGSSQAAAAVEYTRQLMETYGFDSVWLQPVQVPHWVRGDKEEMRVVSSSHGSMDLNITALGNSIGTGNSGLSAEVVVVQSFDELKALGEKNVKGKIVFFNRSFDYRLIDTFRAYSGAVNQRGGGAVEAARMGAVAVIVRSMASQVDDMPHTGSLRYADDVKQIPGVAVSTRDADLLSRTLSSDPGLRVYIRTTSYMAKEEPSFNVIGEIKGTDKSDEYITIGGHLDSWDVGEGAHDDGGGCLQSIEVLRTFKAIGLKPRHSIRAVMFMNEENGLRGGREYARVAKEANEKHIIAMESDRGVFTPRGFTVQDSAMLEQIKKWAPLFEPYEIYEFIAGGGGADIGPLKDLGTKLVGFLPDSHRYFTLHHSANDVFETVDKRELEMGAATMTSLIYLLDKYTK